jgi:hypothetical protein
MVALCVLLASWVSERTQVLQFTGSLVKLRSEFRTIEIDFTVERKDAVFKQSRHRSGKFRMLREPDGTLYGLLEYGDTLVPGDKETYVLRGSELHVWSAFGKTIRKLSVTKADVLDYVARNCWGAVWLLDRDEALKRCELSLWKRDQYNAYFVAKAEEYEVSWLKDEEPKKYTREYRFAVTARDTKEFPRNAVRQIMLTHSNGDIEVVRVTRWAIDATDGLSAKDFPDPAKPPPGWTVQQRTEQKGLFEQPRKRPDPR